MPGLGFLLGKPLKHLSSSNFTFDAVQISEEMLIGHLDVTVDHSYTAEALLRRCLIYNAKGSWR